MPNSVRLIAASRLEKLLKVIDRLSHLVLELAFIGGNELLVGVIRLLVIVALIAAGSDCDLLGSPLWPL
jgi:hypothetical protein